MARSTPVWVGRSDDAKIPDRVKLRIFLKYDGRCQCSEWCNRSIRSGERWQLDHKIALVNGGTHSEGNLQPLLVEHHKNKTRDDVAIKAKTYRKRKANYGIKKSRNPMPGSRASGFKKLMNGRVERR